MTRPRLRLLLLLAIAGVAISTYLTLYEVGAIATVWDPFFGDGSREVLHSSPATALPVPDALLGVISYGLEIVLLAAAHVSAPPVRTRLIVALGALAAFMAVASLGLVLVQTVVVQAWCLLCLASAAISWAIAAVAVPHAIAVLRAGGVNADPRAVAAPRPTSH